MDITVTILDSEKAILESWLGIGEIEGWLQHAIDNKVKQRTDASILEGTNKNPNKMNKKEKLAVLKDVVLPKKDDREREV